jgi:hypothetical protein
VNVVIIESGSAPPGLIGAITCDGLVLYSVMPFPTTCPGVQQLPRQQCSHRGNRGNDDLHRDVPAVRGLR